MQQSHYIVKNQTIEKMAGLRLGLSQEEVKLLKGKTPILVEIHGIFYFRLLASKIVKLEINDNGVLVDGTLIEEIDSVYGFEFENTEIEVPNTGDSRYTKILIFIGGISAISLIGIVVYDYKKRKNKV